MYAPTVFTEIDHDAITALLDRHPLATLTCLHRLVQSDC